MGRIARQFVTMLGKTNSEFRMGRNIDPFFDQILDRPVRCSQVVTVRNAIQSAVATADLLLPRPSQNQIGHLPRRNGFYELSPSSRKSPRSSGNRCSGTHWDSGFTGRIRSRSSRFPSSSNESVLHQRDTGKYAPPSSGPSPVVGPLRNGLDRNPAAAADIVAATANPKASLWVGVVPG